MSEFFVKLIPGPSFNMGRYKLPHHIVPHYHWVPGHVDMGLNNHADLLASMGARKSKRGLGLSIEQLKTQIREG